MIRIGILEIEVSKLKKYISRITKDNSIHPFLEKTDELRFLNYKYICFMNQLKIEKEIISKLKPIQPIRIILFGSYAYGNPDKNSDLDICVIIDSSNSKLENKRLIRSLLSGIHIAKDILTPSTEEFNFYKHEFGSVYMEIDKKGKILWPDS